ncbi:MAG: hypothetical protein PHF26_01250 [Candidatus Gracilibacteria bacterium]|nr:hypothetical protein [Candidatus Gracilibacteria bacterium]
MIVYTIKNENEPNEKMILRYKKMFFQTRVVNKLRTERYSQRAVTRRQTRKAAVIRQTYRALNSK